MNGTSWTSGTVIRPFASYYDSIPLSSFITGNLNVWYYDESKQLIVVLLTDNFRTVIDAKNSYLLCQYVFKARHTENGIQVVLENWSDGNDRNDGSLLLSRKVVEKILFDDERVIHLNGDTLDNRLSNLHVVSKCREINTSVTGIDNIRYDAEKRRFFIWTVNDKGKMAKMTFSCIKYGYKEAFKLAAYHLLAAEIDNRVPGNAVILSSDNPYEKINSAIDKLPDDPSIINIRNGMTYEVIYGKHIINIKSGNTVKRVIVNSEDEVRAICGSTILIDHKNDKLLLYCNDDFLEFSKIIMAQQLLNKGPGSTVIHLNCNSLDNRITNLAVLSYGEKWKELKVTLNIFEYRTYKHAYLKFRYIRNKKILCKRLFPISHDKSDYKYGVSKLLIMKYHASKIFDDIPMTKTGTIEFIMHFEDYGYEIDLSSVIKEIEHIDVITKGYDKLSVEERIERECKGGSHPFLVVPNALKYASEYKTKPRHRRVIKYISEKLNTQIDY